MKYKIFIWFDISKKRKIEKKRFIFEKKDEKRKLKGLLIIKYK